MTTRDAGPALPLSVHDVSHAYSRTSVLRDVSLDMAGGEVLALLGPNGAGKTTLIRTIAGRLMPKSGTVRVCGKDPGRDQSARGKIGLVPQHLALYDSLTARENLEIFGQLFGLSRGVAQTRASEMLELTGLAGKATFRVSSLSGGMKRRLNIAAAVMHRPALLLLDEPSVGVDIKALDSVIALIRRLKEEGYAILLTTHDMALGEAVCDRVMILQAGSVVTEGKLGDLKQKLFAGTRILTARFAQPVTGAAADTLAGFGLSARDDDLVWQGRASGTGDAVADLMQQEGLPAVRQVTLTDPGLADIYTVMTEEETPAAQEAAS